MKKQIKLFIGVALLFNTYAAISSENLHVSDTLNINHNFDGKTDEWPAEMFTTDKETTVKYAIDNDQQFLYLAVQIDDIKTQMKITRTGMNLFIDSKGKKKESKGLEFPLKREFGTNDTEPSEKRNNPPSENNRPDFTKLKSNMMLSLLYMKVFGFNDIGSEPISQGLDAPGKINIAYSWDSLNVLSIEYKVPLTFIDEISSLNQRTISIGLRLKGMDVTSGASGQGTNRQTAAVRGGGGRPPSVGAGTGNGSSNRGSMQEQNIWTKYLINIKEIKN